ncbi:uncharacterized protein LOC130914557 [Corythoichthys intestinalis]|uniref:uncharacterized protein LOC130914557 n=1 Tax=Corythoichthys intestinalis TaxID=161448 RepID=UPI0025A4E528|nr:uncharacterized protein LOC130914557 [Corythoichthys intestinalis]
MMRKAFVCVDAIIINIPIGKDSEGLGPVMPKEFQCVFRDSFKVFTYYGYPKPLGAAQFLAGVLIAILSGLNQTYVNLLVIFSNTPFLLGGMLTYAAGHVRNIRVIKVSFCLNIISFLWSIVLLCLTILNHNLFQDVTLQEFKSQTGMKATIGSLLAAESLMALFLILWQSKAVCRQHFNTLPIVQLKLED